MHDYNNIAGGGLFSSRNAAAWVKSLFSHLSTKQGDCMLVHRQSLNTLLLASLLGAAFAGSAAAQTNVTVSGLVDTYAGSVRMAGDAASQSAVNSGGLTTSWFGFKGTEDLGGGLKAKFALTSFFQADTGRQGRFPGDTMFSRDANVGLSGDFGSVSFGRDLAPNFLPTILFNPFGDSFAFAPLILHADVPLFNASGWTNSLAGDTGWSNEILYTTPNFGGLSANVHYQFGEVPGDSGKNNVGVNALYFSGPLALTAFYHNVKINNPLNAPLGNVQPGSNIPLASGQFATRQTAWMLGGTYDFTAAKLFATYGQTSHDIDLQDKTLSLGASVPAGGGKVLVSWAQTKRSGAAIGADQKRNTTSVGYDYDVSKRTDLYAIVMNDRITDRDSGNSLGLGIRHRF
jgi:predicted porin